MLSIVNAEGEPAGHAKEAGGMPKNVRSLSGGQKETIPQVLLCIKPKSAENPVNGERA